MTSLEEHIRRLHGASRGKNCYPCGYCYHFIPDIKTYTVGRMNVVIAFGNEEHPDGTRSTPYCNGGKQCPDSGLTCSSFAFDDRDIRPPHNPAIYQIIQKDYTMSMISQIYEYRSVGIPRSRLVDRKTKGYHTRDKRIDELYEMGFVDKYEADYYRSTKEYIRLTATGNKLARAIRMMYGSMMEIIQEGDPLVNDDRARAIFQVIHNIPGIVSSNIIAQTQLRNVRLDDILYDLEEMEYIYSKYDEDDWNILRFYTTDLGESIYKRGLK